MKVKSQKSLAWPPGQAKVKSYCSTKIISYLLFFLTLNFELLTFNLRAVRAQSLSLSISPPILEVMIKPGKSITQAYKISNEGEAVIVIPKVMEITQAGLTEDPNFSPEKWITLSNTDLALDKPFLFEEKSQRQLLVKINPPPGTTEHDYYRAIVLTTKPNPAGESSQSLLAQTIASPLIINLTSTGLVKKEGAIQNFSLPKIIDSFDTLIVDIDIKNIGKTYFRPVGKIFLSGPIGKGTYEIIPRAILTGQTMKIYTQNDQSASAFDHTLVLPGLYLGKYEVEADLSPDGSTATLNQKKVFYALPWKAGAAVIVLILAVRSLKSLKLLRRTNKGK